MREAGLRTATPRGPGAAYTRKGVRCHPYLPEHDFRLIQLRRQGLSFEQIAQQLTLEFGIKRTDHSTRVRMLILANRED